MSFLFQNEIPASYLVTLQALDGLDENKASIVMTNVQSTNVVLELASVAFRRLWNVTIFAYNCKEHQIIESFELGLIRFLLAQTKLNKLYNNNVTLYRYSRHLQYLSLFP